jgi:hypothetical protein
MKNGFACRLRNECLMYSFVEFLYQFIYGHVRSFI